MTLPHEQPRAAFVRMSPVARVQAKQAEIARLFGWQFAPFNPSPSRVVYRTPQNRAKRDQIAALLLEGKLSWRQIEKRIKCGKSTIADVKRQIGVKARVSE